MTPFDAFPEVHHLLVVVYFVPLLPFHLGLQDGSQKTDFNLFNCSYLLNS